MLISHFVFLKKFSNCERKRQEESEKVRKQANKLTLQKAANRRALKCPAPVFVRAILFCAKNGENTFTPHFNSSFCSKKSPARNSVSDGTCRKFERNYFFAASNNLKKLFNNIMSFSTTLSISLVRNAICILVHYFFSQSV